MTMETTWLRPEIVTALQYIGGFLLVFLFIYIPIKIADRNRRKYLGR